MQYDCVAYFSMNAKGRNKKNKKKKKSKSILDGNCYVFMHVYIYVTWIDGKDTIIFNTPFVQCARMRIYKENDYIIPNGEEWKKRSSHSSSIMPNESGDEKWI